MSTENEKKIEIQNIQENENPLGTEPISKLLRKFAVPSIISMLVTSLYNIVDQFFIGRTVGELGNAATNIAFPLTTMCIATMLAFGVGGAAGFNLNMGAGNKKKAMYFIGNAITMMFGVGVVLAVISSLFLTPLLSFFGAPDNVLPFAKEYVRITALGFPFVIMANGGSHLIRADGSPNFSMYCNLAGAILNVVLDYLFVMVIKMGMSGAAIATVIGQIVSFCMVVWYLCHYKTAKIERKHLKIQSGIVFRTLHLGMAQCFNQLAMMVVQIVMNKSLTYYGALSIYGSSIPLACSGIIMKVNQLYFSVCIGVAQGIQPIASFNRGAKKYNRVKQTYKIAVTCNTIISVIAFLAFQIFPRQIIGIFGSGTNEYFMFAENFFRIFLFMTFLNGIQPITSTFCTVIGEPNKGMFLSLTRQIIFLLPLIVILPVVFIKAGFQGVDGIMYAAPVADFIAAVISLVVIKKVFNAFDKSPLK
ncbi:MAG: MATE family efflux transporter [Eubacterium sp.]